MPSICRRQRDPLSIAAGGKSNLYRLPLSCGEADAIKLERACCRRIPERSRAGLTAQIKSFYQFESPSYWPSLIRMKSIYVHNS
jgi:hypothetical protein